ncbi:histidine phosphatase family protein [uncultured Sunxiuqinia sp.]|uniref:histidine phosphatase family protein n=1 Tax=Sunxiuqinia rutila TaxID=1397841 RepID=UPI002614CD7F|nr:histidine phosphatase family protein [uncultured Sunxiuqinia sp.]
MVQLMIIRHGETVENANNICQGQQHGCLSELGIRQARQLGVQLKEEPLDLVYSSDLQRTIDTANEILKFHPEMKLITDPLLRERSLTSWEGKAFPKNWSWDYLPEGAETNEDMLERAEQFIDKMLRLHDGQRVAAITHGGLIRAFWTVLANKPASEYFSWEVTKNTSVSRVELYADGRHRVVELNNVDHLDAETPGTMQHFS